MSCYIYGFQPSFYSNGKTHKNLKWVHNWHTFLFFVIDFTTNSFFIDKKLGFMEEPFLCVETNSILSITSGSYNNRFLTLRTLSKNLHQWRRNHTKRKFTRSFIFLNFHSHNLWSNCFFFICLYSCFIFQCIPCDIQANQPNRDIINNVIIYTIHYLSNIIDHPPNYNLQININHEYAYQIISLK